MKRIKILVLSIVLVFVSCLSVNAEEQLFKAGSSLTPNAGFMKVLETYSYNTTQIYRQGEDLYFYSNITNNTKEIKNISVEALLFDNDGKNIGIFNYCSSKDYETEFASYKLNGGQSVTFNYKLYPKYLGDQENNSLNDIAYFAIISDNEYCKVGGYDKYLGKTLDEIVSYNESSPSGTRFDSLVSKINKYVPIDKFNAGMGIVIVIGIVVLIICIAIWVAFGSFLNKLHNRMYNSTTALAYVPIANVYLCVKMAFGKIIGLAYLGVTLLGGLLSLIGFGFITAIADLVLIVAFVLDIVKLITGKYELCYLDVANNNVIVDNVNMPNNNVPDNNQDFVQTQNLTNEYGYSQDSNVKESLLGVNTDTTLDDENNMDVNTGGNQQNNNQDDDKTDESDLSRFFR